MVTHKTQTLKKKMISFEEYFRFETFCIKSRDQNLERFHKPGVNPADLLFIVKFCLTVNVNSLFYFVSVCKSTRII